MSKALGIIVIAAVLTFNLACSGREGELAETTDPEIDKAESEHKRASELDTTEVGEWAGREDEAIKLVQDYHFQEPKDVAIRINPVETRRVETIKEYLDAEAELEASVDEPMIKLGVDMPIPGYSWTAEHLPKRAAPIYVVNHIKQYDRGDTTEYYYRFQVNLETGEVGPEDEATKIDVFDAYK